MSDSTKKSKCSRSPGARERLVGRAQAGEDARDVLVADRHHDRGARVVGDRRVRRGGARDRVAVAPARRAARSPRARSRSRARPRRTGPRTGRGSRSRAAARPWYGSTALMQRRSASQVESAATRREQHDAARDRRRANQLACARCACGAARASVADAACRHGRGPAWRLRSSARVRHAAASGRARRCARRHRRPAWPSAARSRRAVRRRAPESRQRERAASTQRSRSACSRRRGALTPAGGCSSTSSVSVLLP